MWNQVSDNFLRYVLGLGCLRKGIGVKAQTIPMKFSSVNGQ